MSAARTDELQHEEEEEWDPSILSSSDDDDEEIVVLSSFLGVQAAGDANVGVDYILKKRQKTHHHKVDGRTLPRSQRRQFKSDRALECIHQDYLGVAGDPATALFASDFQRMFRISRQRFQVFMEDIMAKNIKFYMVKKNRLPYQQSSLEAKLLLPLKSLAYGVPPHTFMDYFQMSRAHANDCCKQFDKAITLLYTKEYLRVPSAADLKAITNLHKSIHGVDGLLGSLDCTHTYWKNCPKAWQGSYKGKEHMPSIVLEAMADYHLFFWHVAYGYPGTMNDKTILSLSPLFDRMIDGTFHDLEDEAGVVPFHIDEEQFSKTFILVDGIYPPYCRFVKGKSVAITREEKRYTAWQEASRKDIERAFGVLKGVWQFLERPIHLMKLDDIASRVTCCIILHNILVSDRVMGDCRATYKPDYVLEEEEVTVEQPVDLRIVQDEVDGRMRKNSTTITASASSTASATTTTDNNVVQRMMTRPDRFKELSDVDEYKRLYIALMSRFGFRNAHRQSIQIGTAPRSESTELIEAETDGSSGPPAAPESEDDAAGPVSTSLA